MTILCEIFVQQVLVVLGPTWYKSLAAFRKRKMSSSSIAGHLVSNIDSTITILIVFFFIRTINSDYFNLSRRLLYGLRVFFPHTTLAPNISKDTKNDDVNEQITSEVIENKIKSLRIGTDVILNGFAPGSIIYLIRQPLYRLYETIVYVSLCAVGITIWECIYKLYSIYSSHIVTTIKQTKLDLGNIFIVASFALSFYSQWKVIYLTGFKNIEGKSIIIGSLITFIVSFIVLSNATIGNNDLNIASNHMNSLMLLISKSIPELDINTMSRNIIIVLSFIFSLFTAGMIIPAYRFSYLYHILTISGNEVTICNNIPERISNNIEKTLFSIDFIIMPCLALVLVAITSIDKQNNLIVIVTTIGIMLSLKLYCMRRYLQCFLLAVMRYLQSFVVSEISPESIELIKKKINERNNYLVPAALQYLSHVFIVLSLVLVLVKGHCLIKPSGEDATKIINELRGKPYLTSAIKSFLFGNGLGNVSPSKEMNTFFYNLLTKVSFLPQEVFNKFILLILRGYMMCYYITNTFTFFYWYKNTLKLQQVAGSGRILVADENHNSNPTNENKKNM